MKVLPADKILKFKGRVDVPNSDWSIGVPEGYVFSTDRFKNGKTDKSDSGVYDLIIVKTEPGKAPDYSEPSNNTFFFVPLRIEPIVLWGSSFDGFKLLKVSRDNNLAIYIQDYGRKRDLASYGVYICTGQVFRFCFIQFNAAGSSKDDELSFVEQFLKSIKLSTPVRRDDIADAKGVGEISASTPAYSIENFKIINDSVYEIKGITKGPLVFPKGVRQIMCDKSAGITEIVIPEGVTHISRGLLVSDSNEALSDCYLPNSLIGFNRTVYNDDLSRHVGNKFGKRLTVHIDNNQPVERILRKHGFRIVKEHWQNRFPFIAYQPDYDTGPVVDGDTLISCCTNKETINLPDGIKKIGNRAFYGRL